VQLNVPYFICDSKVLASKQAWQLFNIFVHKTLFYYSNWCTQL